MLDLRSKLDKILSDLKFEVSSLRTGRASPALIEDIEVEAYDGKQPLQTLAAISSPEPRSLLIQPWDKSLLPAIEKAIQVSPLGLQPIVDRDVVRLTLPVLTEERKKDLLRLVGEKLEVSRIQVRRVRDEARKHLEVRKRMKEMSEDEEFRAKEEMEKVIGECNKKIEELGQAKEKEIMVG